LFIPYKFWWLLGPWEWQTVTSCLINYDDYLAHENHRFLVVSMEIKGINKMLHVVISMLIYFLSCFRFKLHFIAYVGYTSEGDIALDDISLSPACFGKLNCFQLHVHIFWWKLQGKKDNNFKNSPNILSQWSVNLYMAICKHVNIYGIPI
jgi:hypothetical protein